MVDADVAYEDAKKTWRYLRLAIVVMVLGLAISVGAEVLEQHGCWQSSISAYFHTPVRGFFVGALVTIGVSLVSLRGNTDIEDVLLNLAGGFAPVVALVPTGAQEKPRCNAVGAEAAARQHIENNMWALLVVALLGLGIVLVLLLRDTGRTRFALAGWAVTAVVWAAAAVAFIAERDWFVKNAHTPAAILMFACILAVVAVDTFDYRTTPGSSVRNRYFVVLVAMLASGAAVLVLWLKGWEHAALLIEASWIALFGVFWVIQTHELWNKGLRR